MTCEKVNERLVCCSPLAENHDGTSQGIDTFQETLELPQLGSIIQFPEVLGLLCQILA